MPERLFAPTADAERAYFEANWQRFAAAASAGYRRFGRGVVLVTVCPPHAPEKAGIVEYVSESEAENVWPGRGWPEAGTARAVGEYDPESGFLVLVLDYDAKSCRLHRFEGSEPL